MPIKLTRRGYRAAKHLPVQTKFTRANRIPGVGVRRIDTVNLFGDALNLRDRDRPRDADVRLNAALARVEHAHDG